MKNTEKTKASPLLRFKNVDKIYHTLNGETLAIKNLTFDIYEGEFIAVIGPSGCGKTTILSLATGLLKPSSGEILLNGKSLENSDENIGYMLQKDELFPWRNIEKNILLPLEIKKSVTEESKKFVYDLAKKYGLYDFLKSYPDELSGGMRQRVALIRTLVFNPSLLLLDEPFSALDYQTRLSVCDDVYNIIKKEKKTALLVTHDISEAISVADRIIVLSKRPATALNIHEIGFDNSIPPLKRREMPGFAGWFERLWKELNL